jgi:hypothetical protein
MMGAMSKEEGGHVQGGRGPCPRRKGAMSKEEGGVGHLSGGWKSDVCRGYKWQLVLPLTIETSGQDRNGGGIFIEEPGSILPV